MIIRVFHFLVIFFCSNSLVLGQNTNAPGSVTDTFSNYSYLIEKQGESPNVALVYLDSVFDYRANVPVWLRLKETGSVDIFGGTLPAINGTENAISIKGFSRKAFKSFEAFKEIYLAGNKFGQPTKFNKEYIWYGQNELIQLKNGVKQKVFTFWKNQIYHCQFILIETGSAYLWIQFISTPDTYDMNMSKFDEFMAGFKAL